MAELEREVAAIEEEMTVQTSSLTPSGTPRLPPLASNLAPKQDQQKKGEGDESSGSSPKRSPPRRSSFNGMRGSFSKLLGRKSGREAAEESKGGARLKAKPVLKRRRSWGEVSFLSNPFLEKEKFKCTSLLTLFPCSLPTFLYPRCAANAISRIKVLFGEAPEPAPRQIIVDVKKRNPTLREIREKEKKERSKRGFRSSFSASLQKIMGVEEFGPPPDLDGKYPEKIIKRLRNEARRYESEQFTLPECVLSIKPEGKDGGRQRKVDEGLLPYFMDYAICLLTRANFEASRNTDGVNVFWVAEVMGPENTVYENSTICTELYVSPEYPFKGPTLQYEGHVVEFVIGKNQTDPREKNIVSSVVLVLLGGLLHCKVSQRF